MDVFDLWNNLRIYFQMSLKSARTTWPPVGLINSQLPEAQPWNLCF